MRIIFTLISLSLCLAFRNKQEMLGLLIVYLIIGSLFPLALGPEREMLRVLGAGVIWVAAFLTAALSLPRIFEEDYREGMLEQLLLLPSLPHFVVIAKMISHWLTTGVPLLLASPLLGVMYGLSLEEISIMLLTLLTGTVVLSAIITLAAALTAGSERGGVIGMLLVMPFCLPVLIYGAGITQLAMQSNLGSQFAKGLFGLMVIILVMLPVTIWAGTAALKLAVSEK